MTDNNLKALYETFDRLADLPAEAQATELLTLRESGNAMAFQLEGLLLCHRRQDPTASPFSIDEILRSCNAQQPFRLATDLRDLSQRMDWDETKRCFRLGHYSLQQCLSVSAVGATYLAHDEDLDRDVVILLAFPRWSNKPLIPKRLLDSSRAVAKVFHPNVAAILGTLQCGDVSAVVRQWIPGQNLEEWIGNRPCVSFSELAALGSGIARGLQAIHNQGVLHGDLKPSNIILREAGVMHPVITDFGTAHGAQLNGIFEWQGGTRGFVAPEILKGDSPTPQSDLYSLGIVLFWMATGTVVHGDDEIEYARAWDRCLNRGDVAGAREVETAMGELVLELLMNDPGRRPQSAGQVADALEELQHWGAKSTSTYTTEGVATSNVPSERFHGGSRPLPWKRYRSRRAWMSHAIGLTACAAGSAWMGRLVASQLSHTEPVFVPGTNADGGRLALWDETHFDPNVMAIGPDEPYAGNAAVTKAYASPISIGKWGTIASRPIDLPTLPMNVALFELEVRFNCSQGAAWVRVDMQLNESGPWRQLAKFRNLFDGSYDLPHQIELTKAILPNASRIRFRLGAMALRPAFHPDGTPPIGLRMLTSQSPYEIGDLVFWRDVNRD